jgi:competence ComEA-like helix-hairpin-helix protein
MGTVRNAAAAALLISAAAMAQDIVLPEGKAKKLVEQSCTECHTLENVVNAALSPSQWRETVHDMVKRGATLSKDDIETVVDYLTVYFAQEKVNVNAASAVELQSSLELTAAEADAIIAHRKEKGKIKDIEALRKVAGLDAKKVDAKKDVLAF